MSDRTVLITGSTDGIGKQAALQLARIGDRVLIHGRDPDRGREVLEEIQRESGNDRVELFLGDLSSQGQVRDLAGSILKRHDRLDVLINNAGLFLPQREITEDGLETTFAVNHFAPFLLTHLLLDLLERSAPSRVITVSSGLHRNAALDWGNLQGERNYDGWHAYSLSKLGNVLFTLELATRLEGRGVTANCFEPGGVNTKLLRAGWGGSGGQSPEAAAEKLVHLATSPDLAGVTGRYFQGTRPVEPSSLAGDPALRKKFWDVSTSLVGTV